MQRHQPMISVIVPSFRGGPVLRRCLDALLDQDINDSYEVILVRSGIPTGDASSPADGDPLPVDQRLVVIDRAARVPAAPARNIAVARATGRAFAFIDADAIPDRGWLRGLVDGSAGLTRAVAGSIRNGTPDSVAGTAEYLVAFLDLHPERPVETAWHGATCNLLVPREQWDRHGPFPEDMLGGEDTLLTTALDRDGSFVFDPHATVTHMNRRRTRDVMGHQYDYGRFTAQIACRGPYPLRPLVRYRLLAPLAGAARIAAIAKRAPHRRAASVSITVRALPVVVLAVGAWTVGLLREPRSMRNGTVMRSDDAGGGRRAPWRGALRPRASRSSRLGTARRR